MTRLRRRKNSLRLTGWDYSQPAYYFITICVNDKSNVLGTIINHKIHLSSIGHIIKKCWKELPDHYAGCALDAFIIMPDHVHGIIIIKERAENSSIYNSVQAGFKPAPTGSHSLSEITRGFKTFSARQINRFQRTPKIPFWQRNYYDHIIRDNASLERIRWYIQANPERWFENKNLKLKGQARV